MLVFTISYSFAQDCIDDATVETVTGLTTIEACEGQPTSIKFTTHRRSMPFGFLVADENDIIVHISTASTIDFSLLPAGNYRVYGFCFLGQITGNIGDDALNTPLGSVTYALTINYVDILLTTPDAGTVSTTDGLTATLLCVNDGNSDMLSFENTSTSSNNYAYLITEEDGTITHVLNDTNFDFDNEELGVAQVWGLSYVGILYASEGMNINDDVLAADCYALSTNAITVDKSNAIGGHIQLEGGATAVEFCTAGGTTPSDLNIEHQTSSNAPYIYLLIDNNNTVLTTFDNNTIDYASIPTGSSALVGLSYTGNLLVNIGDDISTTDLSDNCFELSDNQIDIQKVVLNGGEISSDIAPSELRFCSNDGAADNVVFATSDNTIDTQVSYIITSIDNVVVAIADGDNFDFEGMPSTQFLVWSVSYTGDLLVEIGQNIDSAVLSDGCYGVSDNSISIVTQQNHAGTIVSTTGETTITHCSSLGDDTVFSGFTANDTEGENYIFVLTDENGTIIDVDITEVSLIPTTSYTQLVYGVAYNGTLSGNLVGNNISAVAFSNFCFDVTQQPLTINVTYTEGGEISTNGLDNTTVCIGDNTAGILPFDNTSDATQNYMYLLARADQTYVSSFSSQTLNFSILPEGEYLVYGVSFTGDLTVQLGDDVPTSALSSACYDLSDNFVSISVSTSIEGGSITSDLGIDTLYMCPSDDNADIVTLDNMGSTGTDYTYVITHLGGIITHIVTGNTIDFELFGLGEHTIQGIAHTGDLTAVIGDDINSAILADGCYAVASNQITVYNLELDGGTVLSSTGEEEIEICVGDGNADIVSLSVDGASIHNSYFLVTDENGFVIAELDNNFDFDNAIGGPVFIYNVTYTGSPVIVPGVNIADTELSSDCWALSDNHITVNKIAVDGGILYFDSQNAQQDTIYICSADGISDLLNFNNGTSATDADYQYILTLDNDLIVNFLTDPSYDFEGSSFETLRLWGVSYTGTSTLNFGNILPDAVASDGCYDYAAPLTFIMDMPDGGDISINDTTTFQACIGAFDGIMNINATTTSNSGYGYMLLDLDGFVVDVQTGHNFDLNAITPGDYRLWGFSYTGNLLLAPGMQGTTATIASSCYELSNNFIDVTVEEEVEGGEVYLTDGSTEFFSCPGDDISDIAVFETTSSDSTTFFIITDNENNITLPFTDLSVIDFDLAPEGILRLYSVSFTGNYLGQVGTNIDTDPLSDLCYTTSSNFITIYNLTPEADSIKGPAGEDVYNVIVGDGLADSITFSHGSNATPHPYTYIITEEDGSILKVLDSDTFDFEPTSSGVCLVYGVAHTHDLIIEVGDNIHTAILSDEGCYDITDNAITINRMDPTAIMPLVNNQGDNNYDASTPFVTSSQIEELQAQLTPNPTNSYVQINWNKTQTTPMNITIMNLAGAVVYRTTTNEVSTVIEVNQFNAGMYWVVLNDGKQQLTKKLIITDY